MLTKWQRTITVVTLVLFHCPLAPSAFQFCNQNASLCTKWWNVTLAMWCRGRLSPCWKWVCSRLCGAATGLLSGRGGVGVRVWWCSQTQGVLTRGGTTTTAAAGSRRSPGWRRWRRSVTGQTTILQPVGRQLHFVWGIKEGLLRFKSYSEVHPNFPLQLNFL